MAQHVVVVGAVALGPKAACRFKRLEPGSRVTMIDKSDIISYGGCGIPYFVGGEVSEAMQLRTTTFHMLRDEVFFKETKGVDVLTRTEAISLDRKAKKVRVRDLASGEERDLGYDKLVLATGALPRKLPIPGADLQGVQYVSNPHDATAIRDAVTKGQAGRAVILGAGFIGLEMAEAFTDMWEVETTVIEIFPQIMPRMLSSVLARMGQRHMEEKGVTFHLGERVLRFEGEGRVQRVVTDKRTIETDIVVVGVGVVPNDTLARDAGLAVSDRGGVIVDESMRTSDPDIFAGGDCCVIRNQISGQFFYLPLGSMANRQGRVIGSNLAGGKDRFEGAVGSFVCKIFERSLAGAGFSLPSARQLGYDAQSVLLTQLDRAHFYPDKELMTLELVFERCSRRILGIQGYGSSGDAMVGRVNVLAGMLPHKPEVGDLVTLEMAYSPPFSSAMDILNNLGAMADNTLMGRNRGVGPEGFAEIWEQRDSGKYFFLDCREIGDAQSYLEKLPKYWHNVPQGKILERLEEIPRDKTVVLLCNTGGRSYEAQITLEEKGVRDVLNLHGGIAALNQWGLDLRHSEDQG